MNGRRRVLRYTAIGRRARPGARLRRQDLTGTGSVPAAVSTCGPGANCAPSVAFPHAVRASEASHMMLIMLRKQDAVGLAGTDHE
jgi:hypothetical protein